MFVADGYVNTRVAKFDKNGKFMLDWGKKGHRRTRHGRATSTACTELPSTFRAGASL